MDETAIKRDLESIDIVEDVRIWRRAEPARVDGRKSAVGGDVTKISVEAIPADTTAFLSGVMHEHALVITEVRCGAEGLIADLRPIDRLYDSLVD